MELTFEKADHLYRVDGVPKPSLTQILRAVQVWDGKHARSLFDYSHLKGEKADEVLLRGRWVHDLCALFLTKGPIPEAAGKAIYDSAPDWWGYFISFRGWYYTLSGIQLDFIETPMYSARLGFCTTPDLVCVLRAEPTIIEFKTGTATDDARIQTAGQALVLEEQPGYRYHDKLHRRFALELHADGKPGTLIPHRDHINDRADFLALLRTYRLLTKEN
jgi:hypothetical protein